MNKEAAKLRVINSARRLAKLVELDAPAVITTREFQMCRERLKTLLIELEAYECVLEMDEPLPSQ